VQRRFVLPVCTNTPLLADSYLDDASVCDNRQVVTLLCRLDDLDAAVLRVLTCRCSQVAVSCQRLVDDQRHDEFIVG